MFTKQFKVLIGLLFAVFLAAVVFFGQYLNSQQLSQLQAAVSKLQTQKPIVVTATPSPTATPSASFKKVVFPTWTPTPKK